MNNNNPNKPPKSKFYTTTPKLHGLGKHGKKSASSPKKNETYNKKSPNKTKSTYQPKPAYQSRSTFQSKPESQQKPTFQKHTQSGPVNQQPLFRNLPAESQEILENFDDILQKIKPLSSKQQLSLPYNIKDLSHQLTDERATRRTGYMNQTTMLSAYTHYFMWWNLVRLSHLFAGLPTSAFDSLKNDDFCLDLGSGPLTLPIALWLARPELRQRKLTFYCVDLSTTALSQGEEIFLSIVAATNRESSTPSEPWNMIRIKGNTETTLKNDISAVFCANMFNELFWNSTKPLEADAKQYSNMLRRYAQKKALIMVVEPGIPRAAQFISLLRYNFLQNQYTIVSPCPHEKACPMNGTRGEKWCHFVLSTENAPKKLQKLSDSAKLTKDRATLSFILTRPSTTNIRAENTIRIVSDTVHIPGKGVGRYACAPWGLTLAMEPPTSFSGSLIKVNLTTEQIAHLPIDQKTGAKILYF